MDNTPTQQDFFISHASADKEQYIEPLAQELTRRGITFWLDSIAMSWGDKLALKINEGLRSSRYIVLCLSKDFISRPWPETELNTGLAMQDAKGVKRVLPLILNSKELVLERYPIISGLVYRDFSEGIDVIGQAFASLASKSHFPEGHIRLQVKSIHTGQIANIVISPGVSVKWLAENARQRAGLLDEVNVGGLEFFSIRWVLVDAKADREWEAMPRQKKRRIHAIIRNSDGLQISYRDTDSLENLGIYDGIVFHLYAIEDEAADLPRYREL